MAAFFKTIGVLLLIAFLLLIIFVFSIWWIDFGGRPGWAASTFYEAKVELELDEKKHSFSNGAVLRKRYPKRGPFGTISPIYEYSPPLFKVLDDGRVLIVVTRRPRFPIELSREEVFDWFDEPSKANIYILNNGHKPTKIDQWILSPGEADVKGLLRLISVQTKVIKKDKRHWAGKDIPWLEKYESFVKVLERKRKNSNSFIAYKQLEQEPTLYSYTTNLLDKHNFCVQKSFYDFCESYNEALEKQDRFYLNSGLKELDKIAKMDFGSKRRSSTSYIHADAEPEDKCSPDEKIIFQVESQPITYSELVGCLEPLERAPHRMVNTSKNYDIKVGKLIAEKPVVKSELTYPLYHWQLPDLQVGAGLRLEEISPSSFYRDAGTAKKEPSVNHFYLGEIEAQNPIN